MPQDEFRELQLHAMNPAVEETPLTRKIRLLENRLDKAMIKYNEAQSIRKTYEQIVKRLREERVNFDNQLAAIERTLDARRRDYEELLLLSGARAALLGLARSRQGVRDRGFAAADATQSKDAAVQLKRLAERRYLDDKLHREKQLEEKRMIIKVRERAPRSTARG